MKNKFCLIINNGRSGSSYLYNVLKENYGDQCYPIHEGLHSIFTKPRLNNRAYNEDEILKIINIPEISNYLNIVENRILKEPVVECGWTMAHLAPVFYYYFRDSFQYVIMYRNPINFALSRSTMGNYSKDSFYKEKSHEVSPFDNNTMFPNMKERWKNMNEFDKCLFWWLEYMSEAFEFHNKFKDIVPNLIIKSEDLFSSPELCEVICKFIGLPSKPLSTQQNKNPLHLWGLETFPIKDNWKGWQNNIEVLELANNLGYSITENFIKKQIDKYQVPKNLFSQLRYYSKYWLIKDSISSFIKVKKDTTVNKISN